MYSPLSKNAIAIDSDASNALQQRKNLSFLRNGSCILLSVFPRLCVLLLYKAAVSICLSVCLYPLFRHDRRTATKFGTHIRIDTGRMFFSNRSVKQREDILTNKLAANTHVIARKTQIAQCAAANNWGDTWNIIRLCFSYFATSVKFCL